MGIVRKIDDVGRVVIPKSIRQQLELTENDEVEIIVKGSTIIINKVENDNDIQELKEKIFELKETELADQLLEIIDNYGG